MIRRLTPWWVAALSPLLIIPIGLAARANATPVDDYTAVNAPVVCDVLDDYPTVPGVVGVLQGVMDHSGFTAYDAGLVVGQAVISYCPRHLPLLQAFVGRYSPRTTLASVGGRIA